MMRMVPAAPAVASDDAGPDQLGPAALFLHASVPTDQKHAHQCGEDEEDQAVDAGEVEPRGDVVAAVPGTEDGAQPALHEPGHVLAALVGAGQLRRQPRQVHREQRDPQQPCGQSDPVPSQQKTDERPGAGQCIPDRRRRSALVLGGDGRGHHTTSIGAAVVVSS
jgi:hypothetical protein